LILERRAVERGLVAVTLPGRFERIASGAGFEWVLDVAHNPDSARVLADNLARHRVDGRTLAVCGMLADKDVAAVTHPLRPHVDRWFAASTVGTRGLDAAALAERGRSMGVDMVEGGSVTEAMQRAARAAGPGDRIVVFGSFHTVGPALSRV
jgi:dihydrofolate synthase/folylpolyglutamate synthase